MNKTLVAGCGLAFAAAAIFVTARSSIGEQPGADEPAVVEAFATGSAKIAEPTETDRAAAGAAVPAKSAVTTHRLQARRQTGDQIAATRSPTIVIFAPLYGSSPRIIHVTPSDERAEMSDGDKAP